MKAGALQLTVRGRALDISGPAELRIAAFTGPVGARFEAGDLELLRRARPALAFYLGGLGDDDATARANLASVASLRVPTLFVAGGADRPSVIEAAFDALTPPERDLVLHASGLREARFGRARFVIVAGAPFGRYALDEHSCGFGATDLEEIQRAVSGTAAPSTWLLSWYAPAGYGVSEGFGGSELGSPDLKALAAALGARGGLFAYPEAQVDRPHSDPLVWVVPRLARVGSVRADGSHVPAKVAVLAMSEQGLIPAP